MEKEEKKMKVLVMAGLRRAEAVRFRNAIFGSGVWIAEFLIEIRMGKIAISLGNSGYPSI